MKTMLLCLLFAALAIRAEDQVTVEYMPGFTMSDQATKITIGRPPDKSGKLIPEVFKKLKAISVLKTKSYAVPDAAFIRITAEMDGQRLESSSCHTLFEDNPKLVATSGGITALNGSSRTKVLAGDSKDFIEFRKLWEEALSLCMKNVTGTFISQPAVGPYSPEDGRKGHR